MAAEVIWAVQWWQKNKLDGINNHLIRKARVPVLFATRKLARAFIRRKFGYIAERPDLRKEPYGWRMPKAVKVNIR